MYSLPGYRIHSNPYVFPVSLFFKTQAQPSLFKIPNPVKISDAKIKKILESSSNSDKDPINIYEVSDSNLIIEIDESTDRLNDGIVLREIAKEDAEVKENTVMDNQVPLILPFKKPQILESCIPSLECEEIIVENHNQNKSVNDLEILEPNLSSIEEEKKFDSLSTVEIENSDLAKSRANGELNKQASEFDLVYQNIEESEEEAIRCDKRGRQ